MTVFAKDTTYGLESKIKELQEFLNNKLPMAPYNWSGDLNIYGLAKPRIKEDRIVPEVYKGVGVGQKEYTELFVNDKVACTVGFLIETRTTTPYRMANIDVVFTLRIDKVFPTSTTRDIERIYIQAEKALESFGGISKVLGIKEGIAEVFSNFDTELIQYNDMHPWCVFSLNIDLLYKDDTCR